AYTTAAEIGGITRFPTPRRLAGYSGLCPRVYRSGERDLRGPLSKQGPRYLRWAVVEATIHACTHPVYRDQRGRRFESIRGHACQRPIAVSGKPVITAGFTDLI